MRRIRTIRGWLDAAALGGLALGALLVLQPWWTGGFYVGFIVVGVFTVLHVVTMHLAKSEESGA
jgi:hypothetical protein